MSQVAALNSVARAFQSTRSPRKAFFPPKCILSCCCFSVWNFSPVTALYSRPTCPHRLDVRYGYDGNIQSQFPRMSPGGSQCAISIQSVPAIAFSHCTSCTHTSLQLSFLPQGNVNARLQQVNVGAAIMHLYLDFRPALECVVTAQLSSSCFSEMCFVDAIRRVTHLIPAR